MTKHKDKTEKEKRYETSVASEGAHAEELKLEEDDRNEEVAGDVKETKESPAEKRLKAEKEKEEKEATEAEEKAAEKNASSTTAAEKPKPPSAAASKTTTQPPKTPGK